MKGFDTQELLAAATRLTGLTDFGPEDYREGLEALVAGLNQAADIREDRWQRAHDYLVRLLVNRLRMAKDIADHPEILEIELRSPVVILPLPRTGSTKLQRLLSASEGFDAIPFWQMHMYGSIAGSPDGGRGERITETRHFENWMYSVSPDMLKGHPMFTEEPEEEQVLNEGSFRCPRLGSLFNAPAYAEWLMGADISPMYDYMLMQLKYLHWQFYADGDRPFLLKSPSNFGYENQLVRIFGRDTRFIVPHRDPVNVVSSISRVVEYYRAWFIGNEQNALSSQLGAQIMGMFAHQAQVHLDWREKNADIPILDVSYRDINQNTIEVLRQVYDFLHLDLTPDIVGSIQFWEKDSGKNRFDRNQYGPEDFGLTRAQIHKSFAPYIEQFERYLN